MLTVDYLREGRPGIGRHHHRSVGGQAGQGRPRASTPSVTSDVKVDISLANIGGPSAGLMFALGIIDKLGPASLTGGKHIAGTGTIEVDGTVGPIGGIAEKLLGARGRQGATVFLVPDGNCREAKNHRPDGLTLVRVEHPAGRVARTCGDARRSHGPVLLIFRA